MTARYSQCCTVGVFLVALVLCGACRHGQIMVAGEHTVGATKESDDRSLSGSHKGATGQVQGTVYNCRGKPKAGAMLFLNLMPDTLKITDSIVGRPWQYFFSVVYHDSTTSDSTGCYRFQDVPLGYYQVWLPPDFVEIRRDSCLYASNDQADFVRIAHDSIAILNLGAAADFDVPFAGAWVPEYLTMQSKGECK